MYSLLITTFESTIYKNKNGGIFHFPNGHKYKQNFTRQSFVYLQCVLRKCKSSAKINTLSEECVNLHGHNHEINVYKSELYMLKNKNKVESRQSRGTLSLVFRTTTRNQPTSTEFSYKNIESSMYRARREVERPIPANALEFIQTIPLTLFNANYVQTVAINIDGIAHYEAIFFSKRMSKVLVKLDMISFDGTFYTCPKQFKQLWTIFRIFQRYTIPAIHCLLTCNKEELYIAVLSKILQCIPQLSPKFSMSDLEKATRNATKSCFNNISFSGCMFYYNQRITDHIKTHKLGRLIRHMMNFAISLRRY